MVRQCHSAQQRWLWHECNLVLLTSFVFIMGQIGEPCDMQKQQVQPWAWAVLVKTSRFCSAGQKVGKGWTMRRGRERGNTHMYEVLPLQPMLRAKGTPPISVLFKEKKSKSLLNICASGGLSLPLLSYSLRQALCHSSVPRGDTVACTPLCVRTL